MPSRLKKTTITKVRSGLNDPIDPDDTRTVDYLQYNNAGQLTQMKSDPGTDNEITTTYSYTNPFGNLKTTTIDAGEDPIIENIAFEPLGRFVISRTNPLLQTSTAEYESVYGNVIKQTTADGLVYKKSYDAFGSLVSSTSPDGNTATFSSDFVDIFTSFSNYQAPVFYTQANLPGKPSIKTTFNIQGQEVRRETDALDERKIIQDKEYDNLSRINKIYQPYYDDYMGIKTYTGYEYDPVYGYPGKEILSSPVCTNCTTTHQIVLKTVTTTNSAGQISTKTTNALGEIISASDHGGTINYSYNHSGLPLSITTNGSTVTMKYDDFGRQTELTDPNAGTILYKYNPLGQLIEQTDARNNKYIINYDILGRMISKQCTTCTELEATATTWDFVNSGNGLNNIQKITGSFSSSDFFYDYLGRATKVIETIDGNLFKNEFTYDGFNNIKQVKYPSGLIIENNYDANNRGYLTEVKNITANTVIWKDPVMNARGQYEEYTLGNEVTTANSFDEIGLPLIFKAGPSGSEVQKLEMEWDYLTGNLLSRQDFNKLEVFPLYDNLNRLKTSEVTDLDPININYYPNGNIQYKDLIGGYGYDGQKLNAVEQIGNVAGDVSLKTQHIDYNSFNKVSKITEGDYELNIAYGPDQQRRQSVLKNLVTNKEKKIIYFGNYEKITDENDDVYEVYYLGFGAINVRKDGIDQMFYAYTDHLGSINTLTDASGAKIFEQNFDAWGRKRDPEHWDYDFSDYTPPPIPVDAHDPNKWLIRGFTGHEHLDEFALINMNGRVYDPLLGRMLSPDNFVQAADFTQSYNRYSYCFNNPLKYTDFTGNGTDPNQTGSWMVFLAGIFSGMFSFDIPDDLFDASESFGAEQSVWRGTVASPLFLATGDDKNTFLEYSDPQFRFKHIVTVANYWRDKNYYISPIDGELKTIYGEPYIHDYETIDFEGGWPDFMTGLYGPNAQKNFQSINTSTGTPSVNQTSVFFADPMSQRNQPRIRPLHGNPNTPYWVNEVQQNLPGGTTIVYETPILYKPTGVDYTPSLKFYESPEKYQYYRVPGSQNGVTQTNWVYYRTLIDRH